MKLSRTTDKDSLCPICALEGEVHGLFNPVDSLAIVCQRGHAFNTMQLSAMASIAERVQHEQDET